MDSILFLTGISFLAAHELDAVYHKEWRILPFLSRLGDDSGRQVFVALHIPLFLGIFLAALTPSTGFRIGFDLFMGIHVLLHVLLRNHPQNTFGGALSWTLIIGAGLAGAADLILSAFF